MINKIKYIKDTLGQNYLGIVFDENKVKPSLKKMFHYLGEEKFETYLRNKKKRDGEDYHITVVNVFELNKLLKKYGSNLQQKVETIMKLDVTDLEFHGIGTAVNGTDRAIFEIVTSNTLDEIRKSLGLHPKDFHITIGFDKRDVFGVRKNKAIEMKNPFHEKINSLKKKYGMSWVFDIDNLPNELKEYSQEDVEEISTNENSIEIKIDNKILDITTIEHKGKETLWVSSYY